MSEQVIPWLGVLHVEAIRMQHDDLTGRFMYQQLQARGLDVHDADRVQLACKGGAEPLTIVSLDGERLACVFTKLDLCENGCHIIALTRIGP